MPINKIKVKVYQDTRRQTATAYLKFNDIKEEIYLGFNLDSNYDYSKSQSAKLKESRTQVSGIQAKLYLRETSVLEVIIEGELFSIDLESTEDYPITHIGSWQRVVDFFNWFDNQHREDIKVNIRDLLNKD